MSSLLDNFTGEIDLIYIDPPFNTGDNFSYDVQIGNGEVTKQPSAIEVKVYNDTWGKGTSSYLQMMYDRLVLMRDLLSKTGSIYVHLDAHVGHYVKVIMDEIFGRENFKREIIWATFDTSGFKSQSKNWTRSHDNILFFTKTADFYFEKQYWDHVPEYIARFKKKDKDGRLYRDDRPGKRIQYLDESKGKLIGDVWDDIDSFQQASTNPEYVGYPTQKREAIVKRIIEASCPPNGLVADFFCGSGTTLAVAENLGLRWIGCDLSRFAIHTTRKRLLNIEGCRPFELLNLGKYERQIWQGLSFSGHSGETLVSEYLVLILKLYGAQPISGLQFIHGRKSSALVHVGSVDSPVTIMEVMDALNETVSARQSELHVLGWEWEMGMHDPIETAAKNRG